MPPESTRAPGVRELIRAVARRHLVVHWTWALSAGLTAAAVAWIASRLSGATPAPAAVIALTVGAVVAGLVMMRTAARRSPRAAAAAIETAHPELHNIVVTAEELERHPDRTTPVIAASVFAEADRAVRGLTLADVVPLRVPAAVLAIAAAIAVIPLLTLVDVKVREAPSTRADSEQPVAIGSIRFNIVPPPYTGRTATTVTDPERLEVIEGSRIRVEAGAGSQVRFGSERTDEIIARVSGYFAVDAEGSAGRLIPLTVTPDRAPVVRIDAPARDMLLPDGSATIPITLRAADDLALSTLELRFTKVSGSGEQFEFVEGSLPVRLERTSDLEWRGQGALALPDLELGPGDSLVYRAVARDRRPDDQGIASSDTYMLEIAGPGQVALEGVEMPPELERYAMSQQMIVVKLERLRAKEGGLGHEALVEESASIAAEQRTVRANFIFLLGGHVEDEFEEAEHSHEIQEGRLENSARRDINAAISQMTRVGEGLAALDTAAALPPARAAVESLQRAFGRSRYLLRSLAVRSRLDPTRRLTGDLADAADWRRGTPDPEERKGSEARALLADLVDALSDGSGRLEDARRRSLAEAALAIDPDDTWWQEVAQRLLDAQSAQALRELAAELHPRAIEGVARPTAPDARPSSLRRAYKSERGR